MQTVQTLRAQRVAVQTELAKFPQNSKAKRAVELRLEVARLDAAIVVAKTKPTPDIKVGIAADKRTAQFDLTGKIRDQAQSAWAQMQAEAAANAEAYAACSGKRKLMAWVLGIVSAISAAYAGGTLLTYMVLGAAMLTGSSFITMMVWVLGVVLAVYASLQAFSHSFHYVTSAKATHHIALISAGLSRVGSWFKSEPMPAKVAA